MARKKSKIDKGKTNAESEINASIGKRIREIRNSRNMSAETVARYLGMDRTNLSHIETGRNKITAVILWELATLFRSPIDRFFPKVSESHGVTLSDIDTLKKEDERVEKWAKACIKNIK